MNHPPLTDYGFVRPRSAVARSAEEAVALASDIGFPVALKVESAGILHKTDAGGVELGAHSADAVRAAYARILAAVERRAPEVCVDGVRIEEMVAGGVEIIIGLKQDAQFGPVIMFGLGGVLTELLDDVSFRVLPIDKEDARQMIGEIRGARILEGYRGQPPTAREMLVDLLLGAARFGLDLGDRLGSVDLNPVTVWGNEHRLLDAKVVVERRASGAVPRAPDTRHLETFFTAGSVAVVGASATPGKIGHAVLESLAKHEYRGKVIPVNPSAESILGLQAFATFSDVPGRVDLVVCTVDLDFTPSLLRECAARGVHNLVVVSGGGKELGGDRALLEAEIRSMANELDVRVIGPNCIGVFDGNTRVDTFFQPHSRMARPPAGPVAMLSQSGTVGIAFLEEMALVGVSKFVSYGNRVDVDEADLLSFLAEDPDTRVIALYVEGFENGRGFLEAARRTAAHKPVVILKAGRTASAARAALTHTGFLAGSHKVADGAFRQAGLIAVDSYEELVATTKALALQPRASGGRVAMIGNGVGTIVQALDLLADAGLSLATLAPSTIEHLRRVFPPFYVVQNPLDVTGSATSSDYQTGIEALLADPGVDMVMPWFVFQDAPLGEDIVDTVGRLNRAATKPILAAATGGDYTAEMAARIESRGVPVFRSVRDWIAGARGLAFAADGTLHTV